MGDAAGIGPEIIARLFQRGEAAGAFVVGDVAVMAFAYWLIDEIGVATVPGSSFYSSDPQLGRGLVRFAFPKKDSTLDDVEHRFSRLK